MITRLIMLFVVVAACSCGKEAPPMPPVATVPVVSIGSPGHLTTNFPADGLIQIDVGYPGSQDEPTVPTALRQPIEKAVSVRPLGAGTAPIKGVHTWTAVGAHLRFQPSAPFAAGEYLVELAANPAIQLHSREHRSRFRVGSQPRIPYISFRIENGALLRVGIAFSESMQDLQPGLIAFEQDGAPVSPTSSEVTGDKTVAGYYFSGISASKPFGIVVAAQAKAATGALLDGDYSGGAKGTAFTLQVNPSTIVGGAWEPPL